MTRTDLVDKEPGGEEEANTEEDDREVREDGRVDGRHVPRHGGDIRDSHGSGITLIMNHTVRLETELLIIITICLSLIISEPRHGAKESGSPRDVFISPGGLGAAGQTGGGEGLASLLSSVLRLGERSQSQELEPGTAVGGDGEDVGVVAVLVLVAGDDWEPVCRDETGETPDQPGAAQPHSLLGVGAEYGQVEGVDVGLQTGDNLLYGWRDGLLILPGHQHGLYEVNIKEKLESKVLC